MKLPIKGAIDCDLHPAAPSVRALMPYLDDFWREHLAERYIDQSPFTLMSYAPNLPHSARPDWRPAKGLPGADLDTVRPQALDPFGTRFAIANVLHGLVALFNADMAAALCRAVNDWMAREWLDREPRLRASILVAPQDAELAAAEIERCAADQRFVQVLLLVMGDRPLGHRTYWPIYRAAERHGLPIGIHAGSTFRRAVTGSGWPSYHLEDSILQGPAFEDTLVSFLAEGVSKKFPGIKLVLMESGFTWLPPLLWRTRSWRGVRTEVPWIDRVPADIVRDHVRFTLAARRRAQRRRAQSHHGSRRLRRGDRVFDRLPALAIRRRRGFAGRACRRDGEILIVEIRSPPIRACAPHTPQAKARSKSRRRCARRWRHEQASVTRGTILFQANAARCRDYCSRPNRHVSARRGASGIQGHLRRGESEIGPIPHGSGDAGQVANEDGEWSGATRQNAGGR